MKMLKQDLPRFGGPAKDLCIYYIPADLETSCPEYMSSFFCLFKNIFSQWMLLGEKKKKEIGKQMSQIREIAACW